jgi:hypothetical protein
MLEKTGLKGMQIYWFLRGAPYKKQRNHYSVSKIRHRIYSLFAEFSYD